ncbi:MAG: hypothetical protein RIB03_13215 [Henriciella sp.]|uniref:hypothetical protein n=1 Tax=Henriciella sp. TaxID=1968823 RepID=UPI0032EED4EC
MLTLGQAGAVRFLWRTAIHHGFEHLGARLSPGTLSLKAFHFRLLLAFSFRSKNYIEKIASTRIVSILLIER